MFSNLGPLFRTTFRQAEQTDTRQAIIREEKEDGRRKEGEDQTSGESDMWEDSTNVSIDALRTFLINFLKGSDLTGKLREKGGQAPSEPTRTPEERTPVNTATARALGAYQSMAEKTSAPDIPRESAPSEETAPEKDDVDLVASDEVRRMHKLIADLEDLSARGAQVLTIEPAASFLEGLENAVKAAGKT